MNPRLTDDAVADLPLQHGRAELLEEIMRTPVLDDDRSPSALAPSTPTRRGTWLLPAGVAAAVALLLGITAWWGGGLGAGPDHGAGTDDRGVATTPTSVPTPSSAPTPAPAVRGDRAVLEAPGWEVVHTEAGGATGGIVYERGGQSLEITWYPASSYDGYVEDRRHITEPPRDGRPIEVLGLPAQTWDYSREDHTVIRTVQRGLWFEVRGSGMDADAFVDLLDRLRLVDVAGLEAALPSSFVTAEERPAAIGAILDDIAAVSPQLLPPGVDRASITSTEQDRYQLGADVAGAVACAWLDEHAAAEQAGDRDRTDRAAAALGSSHRWPVLLEMQESGEYPETVWQLADQVARGDEPQGYQGALGCSA